MRGSILCYLTTISFKLINFREASSLATTRHSCLLKGHLRNWAPAYYAAERPFLSTLNRVKLLWQQACTTHTPQYLLNLMHKEACSISCTRKPAQSHARISWSLLGLPPKIKLLHYLLPRPWHTCRKVQTLTGRCLHANCSVHFDSNEHASILLSTYLYTSWEAFFPMVLRFPESKVKPTSMSSLPRNLDSVERESKAAQHRSRSALLYANMQEIGPSNGQ